jgi:hypothetical protein
VFADISIDKRLLRWRVCVAPAIVRGIEPPVDSKINGPDGIEHMIGKKYMSKIKHLLRVFLRGGK